MVSGAALQGGDRLVATLREAGQALADLGAAHVAAANKVQPRAVAEAPKRTGTLASSIGTVLDEATQFSVVATASYAAIVHAANPFMTRAAEASLDDVIAVYADAVADTVSHIQGT